MNFRSHQYPFCESGTIVAKFTGKAGVLNHFGLMEKSMGRLTIKKEVEPNPITVTITVLKTSLSKIVGYNLHLPQTTENSISTE